MSDTTNSSAAGAPNAGASSTNTQAAAGAPSGAGAGATNQQAPKSEGAAGSSLLGIGPGNNTPGNDKTPKGDDKGTGAGNEAPIDIKLPEGFKADAKQVDDFKALAKESGLDSAKAQKFFDKFVAMETARVDALNKSFDAQETAWKADVEKLVGAEGSTQRKEALADIERFTSFFGDTAVEARKEIYQQGLGNNPKLTKLILAVGKALRDDTIKGSAAPAPKSKKTDGELFYGADTASNRKE